MDVVKGYTNSETYILPSKGLIYETQVDPVVELRSMTTEDEMRRLSPTDTPNKVMSDIIESCLITKPGIRVYDMCLGDYEFLLHKLRVVTYGTDYKMVISCPNCGAVKENIANLDNIEVHEYDESVEELRKITLPVCGKEIELKLRTPRTLDEITSRAKELKKKSKGSVDQTFALNLQSMIKKIDGVTPSPVALETFVKQMSMRDANYLEQKSEELNGKVGLDTKILCTCPECGEDFVTTFRLTTEFFRPTIY